MVVLSSVSPQEGTRALAVSHSRDEFIYENNL